MKKKAFFIIFKGLSIKQITQFFLEGESPTLTIKQMEYISWVIEINWLTQESPYLNSDWFWDSKLLERNLWMDLYKSFKYLTAC